ncbi:MAG: hypothetical protein ACOYD0_01425 [Candidatus Nanopelagicales bacterium]
MAAGVASALVLAGCGSNAATPSSSTAADTSPASSGDQCLVGQWDVDLQTLAPQASSLIKDLTNQQMSGSVEVTFTPTRLTAQYSVKLQARQQTSGKPAAAIVVTMRGTSRSNYTANGTTMAVSKPSGAVKSQQTTTVAGKSRTTDATKLFSPITDFTSESLAYSCTGNSLRLSNMAGFSMSASRRG